MASMNMDIDSSNYSNYNDSHAAMTDLESSEDAMKMEFDMHYDNDGDIEHGLQKYFSTRGRSCILSADPWWLTHMEVKVRNLQRFTLGVSREQSINMSVDNLRCLIQAMPHVRSLILGPYLSFFETQVMVKLAEALSHARSMVHLTWHVNSKAHYGTSADPVLLVLAELPHLQSLTWTIAGSTHSHPSHAAAAQVQFQPLVLQRLCRKLTTLSIDCTREFHYLPLSKALHLNDATLHHLCIKSSQSAKCQTICSDKLLLQLLKLMDTKNRTRTTTPDSPSFLQHLEWDDMLHFSSQTESLDRLLDMASDSLHIVKTQLCYDSGHWSPALYDRFLYATYMQQQLQADEETPFRILMLMGPHSTHTVPCCSLDARYPVTRHQLCEVLLPMLELLNSKKMEVSALSYTFTLLLRNPNVLIVND
jgi:hypothetical protein